MPEELPWYCKQNMDDIKIIKGQTNHLTEGQKEIKEDIEEIKEDVKILKEKANKRFLGLSNREIAGVVLSIPTLVTLLQVLFKQLGWL